MQRTEDVISGVIFAVKAAVVVLVVVVIIIVKIVHKSCRNAEPASGHSMFGRR